MYNPEEWILVKIDGTDPHYRVFGSWRGSYLNGDSWRLNSGIVSVEFDGEYYKFYGHTGSVYECHMSTYGIASPYNMGVLKGYCDNSKGHMEMIEDMPVIEDIQW